MGLYSTVLGIVNTAFDVIGDLKTSDCVYTRKGGETYDPQTGDLTANDTNIPIPKAAIVRFDVKEFDGDVVKVGDCVLLFPGDAIDFRPALTDTVTFTFPGENVAKTWDIKRELPAPRGVLHKLHIRET